jgi:hypothetical protein
VRLFVDHTADSVKATGSTFLASLRRAVSGFFGGVPLLRINGRNGRRLARSPVNHSMKSPSVFLPALILAACALPAFPQSSNLDQTKRFHFFLPDKPWSLELDLRGFQPPALDFAPDFHSGKLATNHPTSGFMVTAQISLAKNANAAATERDGMIKSLRRGGFNLLDLKTSEQDGRAFLEYTLTEGPKGMTAPKGFQQHNAFVFMVHDGVWVDVHLSKAGFTPADAPAFEAWLSAVDIDPSFQPTTMDFYLPGSLLYRRKNHRAAIPWLTRALEREKQEPTLSPQQHLILIDVLGMAHGISGDRKQARAVFSYGIAQHPDFPMFYYNLGCTDAEDGDLDGALINLRLTLQHRANMLPGETLPDPTKDSSFKAYLNDPRFQEVAQDFTKNLVP